MWRSARFNKGPIECKREGSQRDGHACQMNSCHEYDADIRAMVGEGKGAREDVHYANDPK
jgi:hypothetical protein